MEIDYNEARKSVNELKEAIKESKSDFEKLRAYIALGNAYILLSDFEDERENIINALLSFDDAYKIAEVFQNKRDLAEIEMQKGFIFYKLAFLEEREFNLKKSVEHFEKSLSYLEGEETSKIIRVKYNLANAYLAFRGEGSVSEVKKGIEELSGILRMEPDEATEALIKSALGVGYLIYAKSSQENALEYLHYSEHYFREASSIYLKRGEKLDYVSCENGLGSVCLELAIMNEEPKKNLQEAIEHFNNALEFYNVEETPFDYASSHYNLGLTYFNLTKFDEENKKENLLDSIFHFEKTLEVYTEDISVDDYARISYQLGIAYRELFIIEKTKSVLENEIEKLKEALRLISEEKNPFTYITSNFFLGEAHFFLGDKEKALLYYGDALKSSEKHDPKLGEQIRDVIDLVKRNE